VLLTEELGFTVRHKKSGVTYPIPLLVDALVFARRRGAGWFVTRDSPDKFGRRHVPMSWIPSLCVNTFASSVPVGDRVFSSTGRRFVPTPASERT
jgi:hypothetical protein